MPLEEMIAANTKALTEMTAIIKENNRLMTPISEGVTNRKPAEAKPVETPARRGRGRPAGVASYTLPPDPPDMMVPSFKTFILAWLATGDESEAAVPERQRRKDFLVAICEHLGIEAISACDAPDRPIIIDLLKQFVKDPNVDIKAALPVNEDQSGERSYV